MKGKTIAAIATAYGQGGIGVIRISGEEAGIIADKVFRSIVGKKLSSMKGYTATYGKIVENEEIIDEGVALVFCSPNSYTGENVVEISCHGGLYVTKRVLRAILNAGAVPAQPGEFTKRAFLNGKIDLTQAEATIDLINANGKQAARSAIISREGALYKKLDSLKTSFIDLASHLAAWADYPEEDIPQVLEDSILSTLKGAKEELQLLLDNYDIGTAMRDGITTAIVGRPNVGKSTLMNLLAGCEKSIVTNIPGTTRDIVEDSVIVGNIILKLADTAGIRETIDEVERVGVSRAKHRISTAALILAMFDASSTLTKDDYDIMGKLDPNNTIAIINKTDLGKQIDIEEIKKYAHRVVYLSALNGKGLEVLSKQINDFVGVSNLDPDSLILSNERQRITILNAKNYIKEAIDAIDLGMTLDAVTVSIECAIQEILELTGERASEVVVNKVFERFCVGK